MCTHLLDHKGKGVAMLPKRPYWGKRKIPTEVQVLRLLFRYFHFQYGITGRSAHGSPEVQFIFFLFLSLSCLRYIRRLSLQVYLIIEDDKMWGLGLSKPSEWSIDTATWWLPDMYSHSTANKNARICIIKRNSNLQCTPSTLACWQKSVLAIFSLFNVVLSSLGSGGVDNLCWSGKDRTFFSPSPDFEWRYRYNEGENILRWLWLMNGGLVWDVWGRLRVMTAPSSR